MLNNVSVSHSRVAAVAFNQEGTLLATASEQGTVVRVFTVPAAQLICTLRRGSYPAAIRSLAFNQSASRLAVSSDSGTVHVFNVSLSADHDQQQQQQQQVTRKSSRGSSDSGKEQPNLISLAGGGIRQVAALLPLGKRVSDYVESDRSHSHARLQSGAAPLACALVSDADGCECLLVVTDQDILLRFRVDTVKGGECQLECADLLLEEPT